MNIIDRRLNPKGKSHGNRQRFLRRVRQEIKEAVRTASSGRSVGDAAGTERIGISTERLKEPTFRKSPQHGTHSYALPGNKSYVRGDRIPKPPSGGGEGGGREGSPDGEGSDDFRFVLSKEEFLDIFLDDLELPDLSKSSLKETVASMPSRAGFSVTGSPSNLNLVRTMRNSLSRRIALKRPKTAVIEALEAEIDAVRAKSADDPNLAELTAQLERLLTRRRLIPYVDPVDVRYNRFEQVPKPVTQAVMFCLMDVSGSMTEHMKDLAKRFFMLLYLFITRRYRHVEIVFIRHTHEASEVDEKTFFYATESGGTIVSTALKEMREVIDRRYPASDWNIYAAQASDGDNTSGDNEVAAELLERSILPLCQYFAYIEVGDEAGFMGDGESELWRAYRQCEQRHGTPAMRKVRTRSEIFPVFRDLFTRQREAA
ncbi:MAG: YeaH/YhbH family protein [Alphaproteobacteria bacterium]